jgi:hypothetical protein
MTLPHFIVAGARRCGTTWLHRCLGEHSGIALPAATKELFFFDRNWERGTAWYERYFDACPPGRIVGEVSPSYFHAPLAPERIASLLPDAKLVFILRNPLERVISLYHHMRVSGDLTVELPEALATNAELVDEGFYARHLERFRATFPPEHILVLIQEDVARDGLAPLFAFLGVQQDFEPPSLNERVNERREPRARLPALAAVRLSRALHHSGLHHVVTAAKALGADRLFVRRRSLAGAGVTAGIADRVHALYDADTDRLGQILGRDLRQVWNY